MDFGGIFQLKKDGEMGIVTFNLVNETMNTWTEEMFMRFRDVVDCLEKETSLKGVIFMSGKPNTFLAGANLNVVAQLATEAQVRELLDEGHQAFNRLHALPFPTVAAINGHCLGGGLEFSLACTARIAKESPTTLIGLPECIVGIYPGAGGTQRLPRLIGYGAIELILRGKMLSATKALETGIVDRVVPAEGDLLDEARTLLRGLIDGTAELKRPEQDFSQIDDIMEMARQGVLKATKGREIPGPMLAMKAIRDGVKVPLEEGLAIEKDYFVQAALSPQAKGSINTFFIKTMTDKPKGMMTKGFEPRPLKKAAVLGFGTMGRGIVIDILRRMQCPVIVKDVPEALEPGKKFVKKILTGMAEKKRLKVPVDDLMNLITVTSDYADDFKDADIVIEAVFEDLTVKEQVYRELCAVVSEDCLIASNTSSIPITTMSQFVKNAERFGGIHFFSPVWKMQLVEVIRGDKTSRKTIDNLLNFTSAIKKRPIVCNDNPGFVVNALLFSYLVNALNYLETGNAIEKVDGAMVRFGMPVGPIRLVDEVGIDVPFKALTGMGIEQKTLSSVVNAGRYGLKKSGKGFFLADGSVDPAVLPLIAEGEKVEREENEIQQGLLTAMVTVGKDLLERKVIDDPRMIDVGMIWGTGFPPDKGGPMKWSDLTGLSEKLFGRTFY